MKLAIVGETLTGKSTLLRVLTEDNFSKGSGYFSGFGTFILEDPNLDFLADVYESQKKTPLHLEVYDFEGLGKMWKDEKKGEIKNELSNMEALICVISDVQDQNLESTFYNLEYKLLLTDLDFVEKRLEFLNREKLKRKVNEQEIAILEKIDKWLSSEKPLHSLEFLPGESDLVKGFLFLSRLPQIFVINREEARISDPIPDSVLEKIMERNSPFFVTSLEIEKELIKVSPSERNEILGSFGISKGVKVSISTSVKDALGITVFYTAGKTEAHVWYVKKGSTVREAAGKIHSDLERGFIRAEIIHIEDLKRAGSEKKAKEMGLFRLEGKDYVVKDGDVVLVRFSV